MTEKGYKSDIKRKCEALGVWRKEFTRTAQRLARIYVRIDEVEQMFVSSGSVYIVKHSNNKGSVNLARNPYIAELDILYDQALTYEKELGLTAAALKKINETALHAKENSPLSDVAKVLKLV